MRPSARPRSAIARYVALQLPGWGMTIVALALLVEVEVISFQVSAVLFGLLVLKDILIYPFVRRSYEATGTTPVEDLIGHVGEVQREINPRGYVRLRGELWRAESEGGEPLAAGETVRVVGAQGLNLIVRRES